MSFHLFYFPRQCLKQFTHSMLEVAKVSDRLSSLEGKGDTSPTHFASHWMVAGF